METIEEANQRKAGPILTMILSGMAGGMAWGIRGQYGHETGAMIAGILVGFTMVLLHGRHLTSLMSARAVAMFALGISVGGSMTYGQTVGLTHDTPLIGNVEAYRWGMLGLAIKGGVWIALGSAMFGMALSGKTYRPIELCILFAAMMVALFVGVYLLNSPFDPEHKLLPKLYFSDHWYWEPDVDKPRLERWGGLIAALAVLLTYLGGVKRDWLGFSLGLWGLLGGMLGFPAGQSLQAYNAWHGEWISSLPTSSITQYFNWWNMMETTFGCVLGAVVGLGCWVHRNAIGFYADPDEETETTRLVPFVELILVAFHVRVLIAWDFQSIPMVDAFADRALTMIIVPSICVMAGRFWPYLVSLPIVMLPIAGKTIRQLVFGEQSTPADVGWDLYVAWPLAIALLMAMFFALRSTANGQNSWFTCVGLVTTTWLYFGLNFAFFHVPWPWEEWTGRTPNGLIFLVCTICLSLAAIHFRPRIPTQSAGLEAARF